MAVSGHGQPDMIQLKLPSSGRGMNDVKPVHTCIKEKFTGARHKTTPICQNFGMDLPISSPHRGPKVFKQKTRSRTEMKKINQEQAEDREERKRLMSPSLGTHQVLAGRSPLHSWG